jgi:hypothetical protein
VLFLTSRRIIIPGVGSNTQASLGEELLKMNRRVRGLVEILAIRCSLRKSAKIGFLAALAISALALPARATNIILDPNFSQTTGSVTSGQLGYNITAADWTVVPTGSNDGYEFVFTSAANAESDLVDGSDGDLGLWGPGNPSTPDPPSQNGFTSVPVPAGGNFVGADGAYQTGYIEQTVTGLTPGQLYVLSFWWAASQQYTFMGNTSSYWTVALGSQSQNTATVGIASEGFSGWMYQTFYYTATSSSETLSFLATGTPTSTEPPFALLTGITMSAAPEPDSWMLVIVGFMIYLAAARSIRWVKNRSRA